MRTRLYGIATGLFLLLTLLMLALWPRSYYYGDELDWLGRTSSAGISSGQGRLWFLTSEGEGNRGLRFSSVPLPADSKSLLEDWLDAIGRHLNTLINVRGGGFRILIYPELGYTAVWISIPHWFTASGLCVLSYLSYKRCQAWRRRDRAKRGLCAHCGYNLTGNTSGTCPECGAGIKHAAKV